MWSSTETLCGVRDIGRAFRDEMWLPLLKMSLFLAKSLA